MTCNLSSPVIITSLTIMLEFTLYQRALIGCLIIGFTNGFASAFVLLNRSPLKLSALSHSLLPGVAVATWLVGLSVLSAFTGATITAVLIGLLAVFFSQKSKLNQDTTLAVLYTGAFAFGIIVLNAIGQVQELEHWLLGNILGMTDLDLIMSFLIGLLSIILFNLFRRPLLITLFDQKVAQTLGIPTSALTYGVFALLILILITTLQAVGCILAIGLIVTPAATVRQLTNKTSVLFIGSGLIGALGAASGLFLSYYVNLPAGASIVLVLTIFFLLSFVFRLVLSLLEKSTT